MLEGQLRRVPHAVPVDHLHAPGVVGGQLATKHPRSFRRVAVTVHVHADEPDVRQLDPRAADQTPHPRPREVSSRGRIWWAVLTARQHHSPPQPHTVPRCTCQRPQQPKHLPYWCVVCIALPQCDE